MTNKFNSEEEMMEYIKTHSTPFSEFEKRLDYSILKKNKAKQKLKSPRMKLGYVLASVVLVVAASLGIAFGIDSMNKPSECPFEMGTYVYDSHEGDIESLGFTSESYIVLTEEELSGAGTFKIEDEEKDWVVYGQFYECELETKLFGSTTINNKEYYLDANLFFTEYVTKDNHYLVLYLNCDKVEQKTIKFLKI